MNQLLHSPADVVRWLLIGLGVGTDPSLSSAWPINADKEAATPDNVITIYDTAGRDDGRSMIDGELFYHYGLQVRVRAVDHVTGWPKADQIRVTMAQQVYGNSVTIGTSTYRVHCIAKIGEVLRLGQEVGSSKRSLFTINATVALRQTS